MVNDQHARLNLRAKRRAREITQEAIAAALGCNHAAVSRWEQYGVPLPHGKTADDYSVALDELSEAVPS